jgi:hypothetical protein
MCFIIGQFLSGGVLRGLVNRQDQWGYRIPFALQWFWPLILIPAISFAPESPWHLVRHNRLEDAEKSIRRLQSQKLGMDPKKTLVQIVYTNVREQHPSLLYIILNNSRILRSNSPLVPLTGIASRALSSAERKLLWLCSAVNLSVGFALPMLVSWSIPPVNARSNSCRHLLLPTGWTKVGCSLLTRSRR